MLCDPPLPALGPVGLHVADDRGAEHVVERLGQRASAFHRSARRFIAASRYAACSVHFSALQIVEQHHEDVAVHQADVHVADAAAAARLRETARHVLHRVERLVEIPLPRSCAVTETRMVAREPVHRPVRRDDVRVVVGAIDRFGRCLFHDVHVVQLPGWYG